MKLRFTVLMIFSFLYFSGALAQDFDVIMSVTDGVNSTELTFGKNQNGTDGYDSGLDQYAPPEPPDGSFDARFKWDNESWIKDIRNDSDEEKIFEMQFKPASGAGPIIISWDSTGLSSLGTFKIVDTITGTLVDTVDMTETDHLDTSIDDIYENGINIVVNPPVISSIGLSDKVTSPETHLLVESYPNPFNPSTNIKYTLSRSSQVKIDVYNSAGQYVRTLLNSFKHRGTHQLEFEAANLSGGAYFIKVSSDMQQVVKKITLIK